MLLGLPQELLLYVLFGPHGLSGADVLRVGGTCRALRHLTRRGVNEQLELLRLLLDGRKLSKKRLTKMVLTWRLMGVYPLLRTRVPQRGRVSEFLWALRRMGPLDNHTPSGTVCRLKAEEILGHKVPAKPAVARSAAAVYREMLLGLPESRAQHMQCHGFHLVCPLFADAFEHTWRWTMNLALLRKNKFHAALARVDRYGYADHLTRPDSHEALNKLYNSGLLSLSQIGALVLGRTQ